jgi:hypothetical protein
MLHSPTRIAEARRFIAVLLFLCGVIMSGDESAWASCGDYLMTGHGHSSAVDAHGFHGQQSTLGGHFDPKTDVLGATADSPMPESPCASGRCQNAPIPILPEGPARGFVWKPFAMIVSIAWADRGESDRSWARAGDDHLAPSLFLAVELQPPECA